MIGEQIKKYRIRKGLTQEELGNIVGVTTQAVSRWERGGTPDAEILPNLSDVLGVTIDALFGREEKNYLIDFAHHISKLSEEDAYRFAARVCWAIENGLVMDKDAMNDFQERFLDPAFFEETKNKNYFAKMFHDSGMADMRLDADFQYFFLLSDPKGKLKDHLEDMESIRKIFCLLSDEKILKIIFFMYSMPVMPIAASLISKKTGLTAKETEESMEILCRSQLVICEVVAAAEGEIKSYRFRPENFIIPLICMADEVVKKDNRPFFGIFNRKKAFL